VERIVRPREVVVKGRRAEEEFLSGLEEEEGARGNREEEGVEDRDGRSKSIGSEEREGGRGEDEVGVGFS